MSKDSAIRWGCTKVSPGCAQRCAKALSERLGNTIWGLHFGHRFAEKHWREPLMWNRIAEKEGERKRVVCAAMADVFADDAELDPWRTQPWVLIEATPWLDWLLLTKRPENVSAMVPWRSSWPPNVWLGMTVDDEWAAKRIPTRLDRPALREPEDGLRVIRHRGDRPDRSPAS